MKNWTKKQITQWILDVLLMWDNPEEAKSLLDYLYNELKKETE